MKEFKELIEKQGEAFVAFKEKQEERLVLLEDAVDEHIVKSQRPSIGGSSSIGTKQLSDGLREFARTGDLEYIKAMSVGSDSDGGYLQVNELAKAIYNVPPSMAPMRSLANTIKIGTSALEIPVSADWPAGDWVAETGSRSETDSPTIKKVTIEANEIYCAPKLTQKLLDDAAFNLSDWLLGRIGEKFATLEETAYITGDGVGEPKGLTAYDTSSDGDSSRTWGEIQYVKSGAAGAFTSDAPTDALVNVIAELATPYHSNASWLMNRSTAATIRKLKDEQGRSLWEPNTQIGQPPLLLGYPVYMDDNMPAIAADSLSIAFGDFQRAYTIVNRHGVRLILDNLSSKPYSIFYCYRRVGGGVVDFNAIKLMKFATS